MCHGAGSADAPSLLDLLFWAIVLLAPVYVVLVMVGYQRPGGADVPLLADVRFEPSSGDWALAGEGGRAAALVDLPFAGLFVGAVLLVVAEAFRRGAQLEEDQALTV